MLWIAHGQGQVGTLDLNKGLVESFKICLAWAHQAHMIYATTQLKLIITIIFLTEISEMSINNYHYKPFTLDLYNIICHTLQHPC